MLTLMPITIVKLRWPVELPTAKSFREITVEVVLRLDHDWPPAVDTVVGSTASEADSYSKS